MDTLTPAPVATGTFRAIGTSNAVLVTRPEVLPEAVEIAQRHLREVDRAVSRFRPDSEVSLLAARASRAPAEAFASPVFTAYLQAALRVARLTGGLVDPTVGSALVAEGYDGDLDLVRSRAGFHQVRVAGVPRWHTVHLNVSARRVSVARGTLLDLGASAKAYAADCIADLLAESLPGGFAVNLGGDVAVSGDLPEHGWAIGVEDAVGAVRQVVTSTGQAIATSSTQLRVWDTDDGPRHHIVDPRTGHTAPAVWAQVSCAAATCLEANAASTAAIVLGADAPEWLAQQGVPARLETRDGRVLTTPGWPDEARRAA
ncbi:FAD:protein FMN transferase [Terrabacter tumescens]|uniref:FAD:protein FMN transferase n=1 Tax=Terrabacter tumescens TaxID=60443 RepID=A0ABQ2HMQ1_9MICO|nr:FAD:protein FMN transferase [Terrabacter tumescens]GGM86454.1 FAD:protein FMN transferase [Terrabacter tumescens]